MLGNTYLVHGTLKAFVAISLFHSKLLISMMVEFLKTESVIIDQSAFYKPPSHPPDQVSTPEPPQSSPRTSDIRYKYCMNEFSLSVQSHRQHGVVFLLKLSYLLLQQGNLFFQ